MTQPPNLHVPGSTRDLTRTRPCFSDTIVRGGPAVDEQGNPFWQRRPELAGINAARREAAIAAQRARRMA